MPEKTHGGARKGAGRPPTYDEATVARTVRLTPSEWAVIDEQPGSVSEALREAFRRQAAVRRMREVMR